MTFPGTSNSVNEFSAKSSSAYSHCFLTKDLIYAAGGKEKDVLEMSLNDVYLLTPKIATHAKYGTLLK